MTATHSPADRSERFAAVGGWIAANWHLDLTLGAWWDRLFDAGYAFPTWPVGLGGLGTTAAEARAITGALAAAGTVAAPSGNGPNMGGPTLIAHASPEQQQRHVAPMGRGRTQWCQLFSEPGAGSDLASLATRAEFDGDELVITGQKVWNSMADTSEWGMLLCRTDVDAPKHRGITFVMLDMRQPGVEARPLLQMNGTADFCEVFLNEARAHVADVIGDVNAGWNVARTTLAHERASAATGRGRGLVTAAAGSFGGNLDRTVGEIVERARRTERDPKHRTEMLLNSRTMIALAREHGVLTRPVTRDRVVRYHIHSEVYRLNGQRMRDLAKARAACVLDGSTSKLDLAMLAHESRDLSMSILGAAGTLAGESAPDHGRVLRAGLSAHAPSFGGGTNEIQRNIIGERTLGLPREPGNDNELPFRELRRS
jgi:alkylation response protein AidB-like acyl-CoA dehydrogenase